MQVHFRISGPTVLQIARDCVLSDRWQKAIDILRTLQAEGSDTPMAYEDVFALLAGERTLVEDGTGIWVQKEDPEVQQLYVAACRAVYGGRFYHNGWWWCPYATVTPGGGAKGALWCQKTISTCQDRLLQLAGTSRLSKEGQWVQPAIRALPLVGTAGLANWPLARPFTVARQPTEDLVVYLDDAIYLCERCQNPPLWVDAWYPQTPSFAGAWFDAACVSRLSTHEDEGAEDPVWVNTPKQVDLDAEIEQDRQVRARFQAQCAEIRAQVRAAVGPEDAVGGDWLTLRHEGHTFRVPGAPFRRWATSLSQQLVFLDPQSRARLNAAIPWGVCSPAHMKLSGDNQYHTDWILGGMEVTAGHRRDLDLDSDYRAMDTPLHHASYARAYQLESTLLATAMGASCPILAQPDTYQCLAPGGDSSVVGLVVHPTQDGEVPPGSIVILPNAGVEWSIAALSAVGVIVEIGGALAHVVQANLGRGIPVFRVPGARGLWPEGTKLRLNGHAGLILPITQGGP